MGVGQCTRGPEGSLLWNDDRLRAFLSGENCGCSEAVSRGRKQPVTVEAEARWRCPQCEAPGRAVCPPRQELEWEPGPSRRGHLTRASPSLGAAPSQPNAQAWRGVNPQHSAGRQGWCREWAATLSQMHSDGRLREPKQRASQVRGLSCLTFFF